MQIACRFVLKHSSKLKLEYVTSQIKLPKQYWCK